ncbi:DNA methyltransferase [Leptospira bourretii]|uniref:site-specific DNA-methyltransferase (adenine-specific) n=1 Tax=Leptospira bourretii TaxID=2484962 RepID=A0A4R9IQP5_9LEPT|nr:MULTISPECIES: type ISP restriction/modification enzyme [Leptospira]TGK79218.1 DNA methyltransferase [Leptospira bourretii]TGK94327.1 DNA methyltransferase [Leptospira bourretii]TGL16820.1 DNA methyltransferase [Leptospira levettii]TGL38851.1 DNA methyltransferase [Leptospira bourretii]
MNLDQYIDNINKLYKTGKATEHSYRGDLQQLIASLVPEVLVTNEPARIACGAPDYIITKKDIPIGYIEAKDIGVDLEHKSLKEQLDRYKNSLQNLIITDYISFNLFLNGEFKTKIQIAEIKNGKIIPIPSSFQLFIDLIKNFCIFEGQTIKSASMLAAMMAKKARMLDNIIESAINSDIESKENSTIIDQLEAFKKVLMHDIVPKQFSDIYAQTIAYGMFAARFHDKSLETFSRQEAAELIPKSNPFLRSLFGYIAGPAIDDRIKWVVDSLAEIFKSADVAFLLKDFGKSTQSQDPIIHFYETFLAEYDPALRKARGVWYTPSPVVNFITRSIDEILKSDFGIKDGLSDHSTFEIEVKEPGEKKAVKKKLHRVQFLDPATGTGTFIAELIRLVFKKFEGQEGVWSNYVENHLIPRIHGFEILMASYAMAHLKIDMLLQETGYNPTIQKRLKVFLTNSLEEYHEDDGTLFALARWLSEEARQANDVKRDAPVMIVFGNPPYSGESSNKGEWIMNLMEDYKKEPGGVEKLKERNPKWINDDYVKFIRYGQHFIEKNEFGILAFINPHGFLDNPTFRGMRWNLLKTYDKIYTIDLHGNSKKKERTPDGGIDENVFDIQQGVSINFFIKTGKKKPGELGKVFHYDLYGNRESKYKFLTDSSFSKIPYIELPNSPPMFFMTNKNYDLKSMYDLGFSLTELFELNNVGIVTARDDFTIQFSKQKVEETIQKFLTLSDEDARIFFNLGEDVRDWKVSYAKADLKAFFPDRGKLTEISYRPFDTRYTFYTGKSKGFHCYPRNEVMQHFLAGENIGLITARSNKSDTCDHFFISKYIMETKCGERTTQSAIFPLYIFSDSDQGTLENSSGKKPNLRVKIVKQIAESLGYKSSKSPFKPIDIFDYIYAVLHSPTYRETYKEFLKSDFPRIPYPEDQKKFWDLVKLGSELRLIHLLDSPTVEKYITKYPKSGSNLVEKVTFESGMVYINSDQYFSGVPDVAWHFYIGGYQPAQKWLKDRKGRELSFEEILHYQKIIVALTETDRLMKQIDKIEFE